MELFNGPYGFSVDICVHTVTATWREDIPGMIIIQFQSASYLFSPPSVCVAVTHCVTDSN